MWTGAEAKARVVLAVLMEAHAHVLSFGCHGRLNRVNLPIQNVSGGQGCLLGLNVRQAGINGDVE